LRTAQNEAMKILRNLLRFFAGMLIGFAVSLFVVLILQNSPAVSVPKLVGMEKDEAVKMLKMRGLTPHVVGTGDVVVAQYPHAGRNVRRGRKIYIHLGSGVPEKLPDVSMKDFRDVSAVLLERGYQVDPTYVWSDYPEGTVLDVFKYDGMLLKVLVSKGSHYLGPMPDVRFLPAKIAVSNLEKMGVHKITLTATENSSIPEGFVVEQTPAAMFTSDEITLFVSGSGNATVYAYFLYHFMPLPERLFILGVPVFVDGKLFEIVEHQEGRLFFGMLSVSKHDVEVVIGWHDVGEGL